MTTAAAAAAAAAATKVKPEPMPPLESAHFTLSPCPHALTAPPMTPAPPVTPLPDMSNMDFRMELQDLEDLERKLAAAEQTTPPAPPPLSSVPLSSSLVLATNLCYTRACVRFNIHATWNQQSIGSPLRAVVLSLMFGPPSNPNHW